MAEDVELADSVSMAMLLVLETLTPTERAVFVLREVFDLEYDEIAEAVDKTGRGPPDRAPGPRARRGPPPAATWSRAERDEVIVVPGGDRSTGDLQWLWTCSRRTWS